MAVHLFDYESRRGARYSDLTDLIAIATPKSKQSHKKQKRAQKKNLLSLPQDEEKQTQELKLPTLTVYNKKVVWEHELPKTDSLKISNKVENSEKTCLVSGPEESSKQLLSSNPRYNYPCRTTFN